MFDDPLINQILRLKEAEVDWYQCAKMAWLFVQYLSIHKNENLPKNIFCQSMINIWPNDLFKLAKSWNLVTQSEQA